MTAKKRYFRNMGGPGWKANSFIRELEYAYKNDSFVDAFIEGRGKGSGKTSFGLFCLFLTYGTWKNVLDYLFFSPKEALYILKQRMVEARINNRPVDRVPLLMIDDSTMHLNKTQFWEQSTVDFSKFYNVVRTCTSGVLFSGPSFRLPESIQADIRHKIVIQKSHNERSIQACYEGNFRETPKWRRLVNQAVKYGIEEKFKWRKARMYSFFVRPSSSKRLISPKITNNLFTLHYPTSVWNNYRLKRDPVVEKALDEVIDDKPAKQIGRPRDLNNISKVYRELWREHSKKGLTREESLKVMDINEKSLAKHIELANKADKAEKLLK